MTQYFIDQAGTLSNIRRTAVGGLLVEATLAKVGVLDYPGVRRYNSPSVLEAALQDVSTVPVTHLHPKRFVDVSNYKEFSAGHIVGQPRFENDHIHATLAINDAKLIEAIEAGVCCEVSMGYMAEHDGVAGVTDDGEQYDESRVKISFNHAALVPAGRAGRTVRLMLDSAEIPQEFEMSLKIGEKTVDAADAQKAFDEYDASLQAQVAQLTADNAALVEKLAKVESDLVTAQSDEAIDAAVAKKLELAQLAKDAAEKLERVKAAFPKVSLDGRSQDFIDALDLRIETVDATAVLDGTSPVDVVVAKPAAPRLSRKELLAQERRNAHKAPAQG